MKKFDIHDKKKQKAQMLRKATIMPSKDISKTVTKRAQGQSQTIISWGSRNYMGLRGRSSTRLPDSGLFNPQNYLELVKTGSLQDLIHFQNDNLFSTLDKLKVEELKKQKETIKKARIERNKKLLAKIKNLEPDDLGFDRNIRLNHPSIKNQPYIKMYLQRGEIHTLNTDNVKNIE